MLRALDEERLGRSGRALAKHHGHGGAARPRALEVHGPVIGQRLSDALEARHRARG
jgi:hypothetical protein